jgi:histidinol-phosphate aminotransferase
MRYRRTLDQIHPLKPPAPAPSAPPAAGAGELINLALNESSFGCSPRVAEAIRAELPRLSRYPDVFCPALGAKLAQTLGVTPDHLIFGDGIFELLSLIAQTFVDAGDEVVIPDPSFAWYKVTTWSTAGTVVPVPLREHAVDLAAVAHAVTARTKLVWLCNPHNPMGTIFRAREFAGFLAAVPDDVAIVVDEAYFEYAADPAFPDSVAQLRTHPNLIVLRTFSKAYGLAGLRIGYAIARPATIAQLHKVRSPPNVNRLAQVAALAALDDPAFTAAAVAANARGIADYYRFCREHRIEYIPTFANFILVNVETDGNEAAAAFLRQGIALRPGTEIGKPTWLRITIGDAAENAKVFAILQSLVETSRKAARRAPEPEAKADAAKAVSR